MKKAITCFIIALSHAYMPELSAQSLSPQVIASAGGYQSGSVGSLSFTIGETNTQTLTSATHMLTQGFQQPFKATLNLKMYLQGYYTGAGQMQNVLYNEGITVMPGSECDTIDIQLRQSAPPYTIVSSSKQVLQTNGTVTFGGTANLGQSYYITIKHRNTVETWSANPVMIHENSFYDFSAGAGQAYGSNQHEVSSGVWAFYSGDINKDENVDLLDLGFIEADINNFLFGYFATDINGDGNIDLLDTPVVDDNINAFVFSAHP
jgi:hypothetical protein